MTEMKLRFAKYHALGNDYIVVDPNDTPMGVKPLTKREIQLICDRNRGVGSDGILWGPTKVEGRFGLVILNPDGSEAEKSGNGVRIFARYLSDAGYVSNERPFEIHTEGGVVSVEFLGGPGQPGSDDDLIRVGMGAAQFSAKKIPVRSRKAEVVSEPLKVGGRAFRATCVSMGNPHCVIRLPKVTEELCRKFGPLIETHRWFPKRTNVQFMRVISRKAVELQIWERGAGYTLASGSSSCAAVSAAFRQGWVDRDVEVRMPGGKLSISIGGDGEREAGMVWMTGPVTAVATGEMAEGFPAGAR